MTVRWHNPQPRDIRPAHRLARLAAGAGAGARGAAAASPRLAASPRSGSRSRSSAPPATSSRTGRWPRPAARACSPRRSRRRCWPAPSILRCIRRRTCRPCCRQGLVLSAFLPREDARDAFIGREGQELARSAARRGGRHRFAAAAGDGQAVAAGPRHRAVARQCRDATAQARSRRRRCDAACGRRIEAARSAAGGDRLLEIDEFIPAVGQGAIGIETRADDANDARAGRRTSTMPTPRPRWPPNALSSPCSTALAARRSAAMPASRRHRSLSGHDR